MSGGQHSIVFARTLYVSLEESLAGEKPIIAWSHRSKNRNCANAPANGAQMTGDSCLKTAKPRVERSAEERLMFLKGATKTFSKAQLI